MALIDIDVQDDFDYHKTNKPSKVRYNKKVWLFDRRLKIRLYRRTYHCDNTFDNIQRSGFQNHD